LIEPKKHDVISTLTVPLFEPSSRGRTQMSSQIQVYFYYFFQASSLTNELTEVKRSQKVTTLAHSTNFTMSLKF